MIASRGDSRTDELETLSQEQRAFKSVKQSLSALTDAHVSGCSMIGSAVEPKKLLP